MSSGRVNGTFVKLFSRQSTIPSAHRQGCGHKLLPPHSIGACSVNPEKPSETREECFNKLLTFSAIEWEIYANDSIVGWRRAFFTRSYWMAFTWQENILWTWGLSMTIFQCFNMVWNLLSPRSNDNCQMVMFIAFLYGQTACVRYENYVDRLALPEHLNSWSCKSATFCPFNWLGEWQRVYGASRGALRRNFESHDRWQSHANGLSDKRRARSRGMLENISRGIVVMLLLLSVKISSSWRFLTAISSMQTIWLWSNWRLRRAGTPLNIRFDIAAISLFDKSLWK